MTNLLKNPGFEDGWWRKTFTGQEFGEIFVPKEWIAFWLEEKVVPHDPENPVGYARYEMQVINKEPPFLDPSRIRSGQRSLKFFTFSKIHKGGVFQSISNVRVGDLIEAGGWAHAWSSTNDDPKTSDNEKQSDIVNFSFFVGIDPFGGTDPWSHNVIWGQPGHIYNAFGEVPAVMAEAQATTVTVFFLSSVLWPFKHCDAYVDDIWARVVMDGPPTQSPSASPPPSDDGFLKSIVSVHAASDSGLTEMLQRLMDDGIKLTSVKIYGSLGLAEDVRKIDPDIIIIGRFTKGIHDIDVEGPNLNGDLKREAELVMASLMPKWAPFKDVVNYWEITNEHDPPGILGYIRLGHFFIHCVDIAEANGYHLAVLSTSYGVPEYLEMGAVFETGLIKRMLDGDHVFSFHEYSKPMNEAFGENIPNAPEPPHPDRGPYAFRFRFWEDFCDPMPDVYITEWNYNDDIRTISVEDWYKQLRWYADLAAKLPWVKGLHIFIWGSLGNTWPGFEVSNSRQRAAVEQLIRDTVNVFPSPSRTYSPSPSDPESPDWPYSFSPGDIEYHVVEADIPLERRNEIYLWCAARNKSVGPAATDAVRGVKPYLDAGMSVKMVPWDRPNPGDWVLWAKAEDPRITVEFAGYTGGGGDLNDVLPFSQRDARWKSIRLGTSNYTMGGAGCLVTALASLLTRDIPTMTPGVLVEMLNKNNGFTNDGLLYMKVPANLIEELELVRYEKWGLTNQDRGASFVREALVYGPTIIQVDYKPEDLKVDSHFVVAIYEDTDRDDMWIMDPWDGEFKWLRGSYDRESLVKSMFAIADYRMYPSSPAPTDDPLIGINDPENTGAGPWLASPSSANKGGSLLVVPLALENSEMLLDFKYLEDAGVRVIVNLRWSWSSDFGYKGTCPYPSTPEWLSFVIKMANTINNSKGVYAFTLFNEYNNPREFPTAGSLTPAIIVQTYNAIRERVQSAWMGPGAVDPFNAQAGDPYIWVEKIYAGIDGAEIIGMHGYIRGPNPDKVGSEDKFTDDPLKYQYLNYPGCVETLLDAIPSKYDNAPIYITEFNHIYKDDSSKFGWVSDQRAHDIVKKAYGAATVLGYSGLAIYRWSGDDWLIHNNDAVLGAINEILAL